MKARRLEARNWVLVFQTDEEVLSLLKEFAKRESLSGARFQGIGAFSRAIVGFFDLASKQYRRIAIEEQVEVLSLVGNVAQHEGLPRIHSHVTLGASDGTARGGHLIEGHVRPTLELFLTESAVPLSRHKDSETGLPLLDP